MTFPVDHAMFQEIRELTKWRFQLQAAFAQSHAHGNFKFSRIDIDDFLKDSFNLDALPINLPSTLNIRAKMLS